MAYCRLAFLPLKNSWLRMAITPDDLLQRAKLKMAEDPDEFALREAIGRSYYSAFHSLLGIVSRLPKSSTAKSDEISHHEIVERLVEWRVKDDYPSLVSYRATSSQIWRALKAARAKRVIADYRLGTAISSAEAKSHILSVEKILRLANVICTEMDAEEMDQTRAVN